MLFGLVMFFVGLFQVQKGDFCVIFLVGNRVFVVIGVVVMFIVEMFMLGLKGRGFFVFYIYQDYLWWFGNKFFLFFIVLLVLDLVDFSEEKGFVQMDFILQGDMRYMILEGEEENGEVYQVCEDKFFLEVLEDISIRGLN